MTLPFVSRKVVTALKAAMIDLTRDNRALREDLEDTGRALEREQTLRVSAEAVSAERKEEVERLLAQLTEARADAREAWSGRLKSLDAVNVKLMEPRVEEKVPDISQYKREAQNEVISQTVQRVRQMHRDVDRAVIAKLHPKFAHLGPHRQQPAAEAPGGVPMNEPVPAEAG